MSGNPQQVAPTNPCFRLALCPALCGARSTDLRVQVPSVVTAGLPRGIRHGRVITYELAVCACLNQGHQGPLRGEEPGTWAVVSVGRVP